MTLVEAYATWQAPGVGKLAFILDASESATPLMQDIIALVRGVLNALPAEIEARLYFLGNPAPYPVHMFDRSAAQWFQDNRQRASLIAPIWETFDPGATDSQVIVGSGPIFDLVDWQGSSLAQQTLLVSLGRPLQAEAVIANCMVKPSGQDLLQHLHDPLASVIVEGTGFMPTWWDNGEYRLRLETGMGCLVAERSQNYALTLYFLAENPDAVHVRICRISGRETVESPVPTESPPPAKSNWGWLDETERAIFSCAVCRESFPCPYGRHQHEWDEIRCRASGKAPILGELVYPSLKESNVRRLLVFREMETGIRYKLHEGDVLRVGPSQVVVRDGNRAYLVSFDGATHSWVRGQQALQPYALVGENAYALVI